MNQTRTVAIRPEDYEALKQIADVDARDMTEILHRSLALYAKEMGYDLISNREKKET